MENATNLEISYPAVQLASSFTGSPLARTPDHHRADLAYAYAVGDLDLDLLVVDHLGHLADQPPEVMTVSPRRKFFTSS